MSFYSVPTLSYQQQQKLKRSHRKPRRKDARSSDEKDDNKSNISSSETRHSIGSKHSGLSQQDQSSRSRSRRSSKDTLSSNLMSQLSIFKTDEKSSESASLQDSKSQKSRRTSIVSVPSFVSEKLSVSQKDSLSDSVSNFASAAQSGSGVTSCASKHSVSNQSIQFEPLTDLFYMNSAEESSITLPETEFFQQKFSRFLDGLKDHHVNDPINFASVRDQSFSKFVSRQRTSRSYLAAGEIKRDGDVRYYEDLLLYKVLETKNLVRRLTNTKIKEQKRQITVNSTEELVQGNLGTYLEFVMNLPNVDSTEKIEMGSDLQQHYNFKKFLIEVSNELFALKKRGFEDISLPSSRLDFLFQIITQRADEFLLLEKYIIQILAKLNNDTIIEGRILRDLFQIYSSNRAEGKSNTIKVLNYNTYFSSQYSWHIAVTVPFVKVFESSVLNETENSMQNVHEYEKILETADQTDLQSQDTELSEEFFKHVNFQGYEQFMKMSKRDLADFQRAQHTARQTQSSDESNAVPSKPKNFEYLSQSLSSIRSNTFDVIHSRDFPLQVSPQNLNLIVGEFHRLLKKGGVLELPLILASDIITDFHGAANQSNNSEFSSLGFQEQPFFIARFIESLLKILDSHFGSKNVKFSSLLLTNKNEMSNLLIKHIAFMSHEIFGKLEQFCDLYGEDHQNVGGDSKHFYFYIRAQKNR